MLGNIERAAKSWREGDDSLAAIHLAHAALPRPHDPDEAALRLFITDAFIKAGTDPLGILQALGLDAAYVETVAKYYDELEPRVPAGNSIFSGRWTKILSLLGDLTAPQTEQLAVWAARVLGPLAAVAGAVEVFRLIFVPSDNRIGVEGDIDGLPGGHYSWNRDEAQLHITYKTADGEQRTFTAQRKDNKFLGPQGQVVGVVLPDDNVTIDADALPGRPANDNEPKLCPRPQPDKRTNDKGLEYESFMRPLVNPFMPTPLGLAYYLPNPSTGKAVEFDDCEQKTGTMIDYKDQYWELLTSDISEFIIAKLKKEALRQIAAAGSRGIRWYFSEKEAADFVRDLFRNDPNIRGRIVIEDRPFPGSRR